MSLYDTHTLQCSVNSVMLRGPAVSKSTPKEIVYTCTVASTDYHYRSEAFDHSLNIVTLARCLESDNVCQSITTRELTKRQMEILFTIH